MKRLVALVGLAFAIALPSACAEQSPDDQYIAIYSQIQQADTFLTSGQPRLALAGYTQSLAQLQKFQKMFPDWDSKIVGFRLDYLTEKINGLQAQFPADNQNGTPQPAPPAPTPANSAATAMLPATNAVSAPPVAGEEMQLSALRAQAQGLQAENELLQAKLKEALRAQPAMVDPQEFAKAQAQVLALTKENDLLRASLTPGATNGSPAELLKVRKALAGANKKLAEQSSRADKLALDNQALEQRLAVDEAQAVPYTPEELALLKLPKPALAANAGGQKKSANKLPASAAPLVAEAQKYFSTGDYARAEADYLKILQQDPNNALVLANLATIELHENKLDDAHRHAQAALAQSPDDAFNLAILGKVEFAQGKFDDALDALSRAAKASPQNLEIQNYLGATLAQKGLRAQAETAFRKVIELDPHYASAHNNLAVIYLGENPPMAALARWHYQKALDLGQPRNPDLEKKLADAGAPLNPQ